MFICAFILHIVQQPEIFDSINRIRFIANHPHKFERVSIPLTICFMKLFIDVSTETVSIIFTAVQNQVQDVIMNFIAMITISQVSQMYFNSLRSHLKDELFEIDFKIPITNEKQVSLKKYLSVTENILVFFNELIYSLYAGIYFYVYPVLIYYVIRTE